MQTIRDNIEPSQDRASVYLALGGLALVVLGGFGLVFIDLLRLRFDPVHDLFHLMTGVVALYAIVTDKERLATVSTLGLGTVYLLLGIGGLVSPTLWGIGQALGVQLELTENILHLIIGGLGLYAGIAPWMTSRTMAPDLPNVSSGGVLDQ